MNNQSFKDVVEEHCGPGNFDYDGLLCDQCDGSGVYFIDDAPQECICLEKKSATRTLLKMCLDYRNLLTIRNGYVPDSQFLDMQRKYLEVDDKLKSAEAKVAELENYKLMYESVSR